MIRRAGALGAFVSLALALPVVTVSMGPVAAAPPVATPSPGYDARLQESRKPDAAKPDAAKPDVAGGAATKPVLKKHKRAVRRRWRGAQVYDEAAPGPPYPPYPYYEARPEYYRPYPYYAPIIPLYGFGFEFGW